MPNIQLNAGEVLLKEQDAGVKEPGKNLYYRGRIFLTSQRFVSHKRSIWIQAIFGLILAYAFKGRFNFDIPLTSLRTITKKSAMGSATFILGTVDGKEYTIAAPFKVWFPAFRDALAVYHQLQLVDTGNDSWAVQR